MFASGYDTNGTPTSSLSYYRLQLQPNPVIVPPPTTTRARAEVWIWVSISVRPSFPRLMLVVYLGLSAVPVVLDILNCTEVTDEGLQRLCAIDLAEFQKARVEQRVADFALTGLRIQEAEVQIFVGEDVRKHALRNGVRRNTFGVNDGMYLYKSSSRFKGWPSPSPSPPWL